MSQDLKPFMAHNVGTIQSLPKEELATLNTAAATLGKSLCTASVIHAKFAKQLEAASKLTRHIDPKLFQALNQLPPIPKIDIPANIAITSDIVARFSKTPEWFNLIEGINRLAENNHSYKAASRFSAIYQVMESLPTQESSLTKYKIDDLGELCKSLEEIEPKDFVNHIDSHYEKVDTAKADEEAEPGTKPSLFARDGIFIYCVIYVWRVLKAYGVLDAAFDLPPLPELFEQIVHEAKQYLPIEDSAENGNTSHEVVVPQRVDNTNNPSDCQNDSSTLPHPEMDED